MSATPLNIQRTDQGLPAFEDEPGGGWQLLDKPNHMEEDQSMFKCILTMVVTLDPPSLQHLLTMEYLICQLNMCPISLLLFLPHPPEVTLPLKLQLQVLTLPIMNFQLTMSLHILLT